MMTLFTTAENLTIDNYLPIKNQIIKYTKGQTFKYVWPFLLLLSSNDFLSRIKKPALNRSAGFIKVNAKEAPITFHRLR